MEIAYYPGCSLKQSSNLYDIQTRDVFNRLGIIIKEIDDWSCCGATSAGKIDDFLAIAMPARNIGIAERQGFTEMVIPCSACYSRTLVAQTKLAGDPDLKKRINDGLFRKVKGDLKVSSILEVLARIPKQTFKQKMTKKFKQMNAVCYYGCMLTRFPVDVDIPDDVENPQTMEQILKLIGVHALDWNYKTACCGASAAMNDPDTALMLMHKIIDDALERGAECFVVTCPMCQMNLDVHQDKVCEKYGIKKRLPVYFLTELIGLALGMDIQDLQIDRHFIQMADA
jgi:heterodisulfide reductase subunit B